MSSFIQQCLNGNVLLEDIDDFIHQWHNTDSDLGIYDYLGMTRREYFLWVENPEILPHIVNAHRYGCEVETAIQEIHASRNHLR